MDDSHIVETVDPEAAFSVLADGSRIDILRALWEADGQTATFSELRDAVGMSDSGRFNYHLGELTDRFVRKAGDEYELRAAGRHVVGSLLSGAYTVEGAIDPIDLGDPCPICGSGLTFDYADDRADVDCDDCDFEVVFPIPPGAFADYPAAEFPDVADRYVRTLLSKARNGFCSACEGRVRSGLSAKAVGGPPADVEDVVMVTFDCERCGEWTRIDLATLLLDHPAVASAHYDHGIDVRTIELWQLGSVAGLPRSALADEGETHRAEVTYAVDGERVTLLVDDDLSVVSVERETRRSEA